MSKVVDCQKQLIAKSEEKGFLTFDDIMDLSDTYSLSVSEVDQLSEALEIRGTIITFYECNLEILWILLKDMDVLNPEGAKTKGKGKIKEFIRKRPNDETIHRKFSEYMPCTTQSSDYSCQGAKAQSGYSLSDASLLQKYLAYEVIAAVHLYA